MSAMVGELQGGGDLLPQQINVDTNYKRGFVIDCGSSFSSLSVFAQLFVSFPTRALPLPYLSLSHTIIAGYALFA